MDTMMANLTPEVAVDFIKLLNSLGDIPKRGKVSYGRTFFHYVLLDDILSKIKSNENFGLMFMPFFETAEEGVGFLQAVLLHKSGVILESPMYHVNTSNCKTIQERGAQLTYAKRYLLSTWLAIAADDDLDGADEKAQIEPALPKQQPRQEQKSQPQAKAIQPKQEAEQKAPEAISASAQKETAEQKNDKFKRATAYTSVKFEKTLGELSFVRLMETADNQDESEQTRAAAAYIVKCIEHWQSQKSMQFHQEELGDLDFEQLEEVTKSSLESSIVQKSAKMLLKFYNN